MIISLISYKGGVGKSCMSRNIAVHFAQTDYKVCIIDSDESQATSKWAGRRIDNEIEPYIHVVGVMDAKSLRATVKHQYNDYDILVIDSPPSDQTISRKIMQTSNLILIPITPTGNDELDSIAEMLERYGEIQEEREDPTPAYFLINRFDPRVAFHKSFIAQLEEMGREYDVSILPTRIHYRPAIYGEISTFGQGVTEHKDRKAKKEFHALADQIVGIGAAI